MRIDSPYTLLVILFVLILGAIGCIYLIFFSLRRMRGKEGTTKKRVSGRITWFRRLVDWMSEPVSGSTRAPPLVIPRYRTEGAEPGSA